MRTLTFEQVSDSRFTEKPAEELREIKRAVIRKLSELEGLTVRHDPVIKYEFDGLEYASQFRCRFYVHKQGRKTTWDDVYRAVNSVKAVPYKFA